MRTYDVAPLFRSSVGFDRLLDLLSQAERAEATTAWPPYNIEKVAEDEYRITMAVAGFTSDEIELTQHDTALLVSGQKKSQDDPAPCLPPFITRVRSGFGPVWTGLQTRSG